MRVVQGLLGLAEDSQWSDTMQKRLENYLVGQKDQLGQDFTLTAKNMKSLKDIYYSKYNDIKNATEYVKSNIDRMAELANKTSLTDIEIQEAKMMVRNIKTYFNANKDSLAKLPTQYESNKEFADFNLKLNRIYYNLYLKSDPKSAFNVGDIAQVPFVENLTLTLRNNDKEDLQKKAATGDLFAQAALNEYGINMEDPFTTSKKAFRPQYVGGAIASIAAQTALSAFLTGGALTSLNVSSILAKSGVPKVLIPVAENLISGMVNGIGKTLRDATKPGYNGNITDDLKNNIMKEGVNSAIIGLSNNELLEIIMDQIGVIDYDDADKY